MLTKEEKIFRIVQKMGEALNFNEINSYMLYDYLNNSADDFNNKYYLLYSINSKKRDIHFI